MGGGIAEDTGQQPGHRLDHDQDGCLAAGQDVVADGDLADVDAVAVLLDDAAVDALVAGRGEHQPGLGGEFDGELLGEGAPLGVGTTITGSPSPDARISSSASPHGSGFMTMPGPPP